VDRLYYHVRDWSVCYGELERTTGRAKKPAVDGQLVVRCITSNTENKKCLTYL
jgi:hypothetical protein